MSPTSYRTAPPRVTSHEDCTITLFLNQAPRIVKVYFLFFPHNAVNFRRPGKTADHGRLHLLQLHDPFYEAGRLTAAHDLSDGGLAVALAEMAMASGIGAKLDAPPKGLAPHAFWFGEDQARYVVTTRAEDADTLIADAKAAGVPVTKIGVTGGKALALPGESPVLISSLTENFEGWLPAYMAGAS